MDYFVFGFWINLCGICIFQAQDIAGKFHCCKLHAIAQTKVRDFIFPGIFNSFNFSFNIPGTKPSRDIEGKIEAIRYARENKIPYFGLCYGMQLAVVEYARDVLKFPETHTTDI